MLLDLLTSTIEILPSDLTQYAIAPMLALAAGSAALKGATGVAQMLGAGKEKEQPKFQTPSGYAERSKRVRSREAMGGTVPGQDLIEQNISASTSQGIEAYKEAGNQANLQEMIAQSVQNEQSKYAELGVKAAQIKEQRALDVDKVIKEGEEYDVMGQKREMELAEAQEAERLAKKGAGMQNITGALDSAVEIGTTFGKKT